MRELWQDFHYSARSLVKSPGLAAVAILTLALGIGANAAIFSILDPLLLRKLPVQDPDSLVFLGNAGLWRMARSADYDTAIISELSAYRHYRDENRALSGVLFFTGTEEYDLTRGDEASSASGETVSANYFSLLGVRPYLGRLIDRPDDFARKHGLVLRPASKSRLQNHWRRAARLLRCRSRPQPGSVPSGAK